MGENALDTKYIAIKFRFKAVSVSSYGIGHFLIDMENSQMEKLDIVSSHFSEVADTNIAIPWSELDDTVSKMKWNGEFAKSLTNDIQIALEAAFKDNQANLTDMIENIKDDQISKVNAHIEESLLKPVNDRGTKCEVAVEAITEEKMEEIKNSKIQQSQTTINEPKSDNAVNKDGIDPNAVLLDMSLILSPVSGVLENELTKGQKIFVKLSDSTSSGNYYIDYFNARVNGEIVPIPVSFHNYRKEGKNNILTAQISEGVFGKAVTEDVMKVKLYDQSQDKRTNQSVGNGTSAPAAGSGSVFNDSKVKESRNKSISTNFILPLILIVGGLIVIVLLVVIYLMI